MSFWSAKRDRIHYSHCDCATLVACSRASAMKTCSHVFAALALFPLDKIYFPKFKLHFPVFRRRLGFVQVNHSRPFPTLWTNSRPITNQSKSQKMSQISQIYRCPAGLRPYPWQRKKPFGISPNGFKTLLCWRKLSSLMRNLFLPCHIEVQALGANIDCSVSDVKSEL